LQKAAGNSNFKHNSLLTQHLPSTGCIAKANAVRCAHDNARGSLHRPLPMGTSLACMCAPGTKITGFVVGGPGQFAAAATTAGTARPFTYTRQRWPCHDGRSGCRAFKLHPFDSLQ
jgi:hypothetical protein